MTTSAADITHPNNHLRDVRNPGSKMFDPRDPRCRKIAEAHRKGPRRRFPTMAPGSSSVLIEEVEEDGCDVKTGGLGGGAPLSTTHI